MHENLLSYLLGKFITVGLPFAVLITGIVCVYDFFVLRKPRRAKLDAVEKQFETLAKETDKQKEAYEQAKEAAGQEPVLVEYSKSFFPVLFIVFFLRSFLFEPYQIPSGSMIPTLQVGDFIVVNKFAYGLRVPIWNKTFIEVDKPKRGDAMVFFPPHIPNTYYIKRVIGLPGDKIRIHDNVLYINDVEMKQEFVKKIFPDLDSGCARYNLQPLEFNENLSGVIHKIHACDVPQGARIDGEWIVPEKHYFMMGDNRDNSLDSRFWQDSVTHEFVPFVSEDAIVGKAVAVWMHWEEFFSIPNFNTVGVIH